MKNILDELKDMEDRARKLKNQNLADVIASAHGKVRQISEHPDVGLLDEKPAGEFDPKAAFDPNAAPPVPPPSDPNGPPPVTGL